MDGCFIIFSKILEKSAEKYGDKPLTVAHLSNIAKMVIRINNEMEAKEIANQEEIEAEMDEMRMEIYADQLMDQD